MTRAWERRRLAAALLAATGVLACQSAPAPGPVHWQTGRRAEVTPDGLHRIVTYRVSSAWLRPGASFAGYRKVLIAPVSVAYKTPPRPVPAAGGDGRGNYPLSPTQLDRMRRMFREALEAEFAESAFEVVAEPASDVLRVTIHVVDLEVNTPPETGRNRVYVSVAGEMTGILDRLVSVMTPVMHALGLPGEAAAAFIFGFFRRDFGAAGLYDLQTSGMLSAVQLAVAGVTLTLFVPCVAQFLMMKKERGWKASIGIFVFVSALAFATGWGLNRFLLFTGILA